MANDGGIVTVGLSPAWDIICRGADLDWGRHPVIDEQVIRPAGKALNISYALAWMGLQSVAAGLWGHEDYDEMEAAVGRLGGLVQAQMTAAEGRTRQNITVVDTRRKREIHLRCKSSLASERSLRRLGLDLARLVRDGSTCVFAGSLPAGPLLDPVIDLVRACRRPGTRIAVDTHGPALRRIVDEGLSWLVAPNVEELRELLRADVEDTPEGLASAARCLLDKVEVVLVSRGEKGALVITEAEAWAAWSKTQGEALSTVGCGDHLLAGFLAGFAEQGEPHTALTRGVKVASARAWGLTETRTWRQVEKEIPVAAKSL